MDMITKDRQMLIKKYKNQLLKQIKINISKLL